MLRYSHRLYTRIRNDEKATRIGFILISIILVLILVNVLYLNFASLKQEVPESAIQTTRSNDPDIEEETEPTVIPTPTPAITPLAPVLSTVKAKVKDNFIPLGSGTTTAKEWSDIPGAQATVDFSQYSPIDKIIFEASISVPTGNQSVSVRIFNVTDRHPVWYSEVTANSSPSYLISSPVVYDLGAKTYQVQMKTQLGFSADLTQSRIHVISK